MRPGGWTGFRRPLPDPYRRPEQARVAGLAAAALLQRAALPIGAPRQRQPEQFTITVRGKPIADLVPHRSQSAHSLKAAVHALQGFPRIQGVADADVANFVSEGRR
jgi:antitoxin (DNA-binding transcriptional repressor) of toxin-antitoxin stability system